MNLLFINMPTIHFFVRSNNDKSKTFVLYCRVKVNGTTSEFSTKEKIDLACWNQSSQKYKCKSKTKTHYVNSLLETISYKIKTKSLQYNDELSAKELIQKVFEREKKEKILTLLEIIDLYIDELKQRGTTASGTIKAHTIKKNNLIHFQTFTKQIFDAENFTPVIAEKFKEWFRVTKKTENVTSSNRNVLFYKIALKFALKKGFIQHFSLYNYTGEKDPVKDPVFITKQEFETMLKQTFASKMLIQCKDLYIFQCATGLSYGDLWSDFEIQELNEEKVITGKRTKNGQAFFIPLNDVAESILFKYDYSLPRYCNAVYNRILKEIASVCGIEKRLTTHTGRKTFATLLNDDGWSRESIALMLGHNSVKTTELYYLGKSFNRIENELKHRQKKSLE
jgi:integrase/recombinase XerD